MTTDMDTVRVAVRIRPLVKSEIDRGCQNVIDKVPGEPQIQVKNNDAFTFNHVFALDVSQEFIYENAVQNMVEKLFKGYNVTILAYGQTGSGKTYTMGTAFSGEMNADVGVIPRAMYDIFKQIDDMTDYTFKITCSFMELYQEQLYDLLSNNTRENSIVDIREDGNKGIIIPGLTETPVNTAIETTNCLIKGSAGRAVGATAMNAQSSRSHAIFTVSLQMTKKEDSNISTSSKFHLVDLAGSERSKKTKATGDRFKEGVKINQGLLALGNVISALGTGQSSGGYVGYRDSKLTRLLQDSLGGNSVTLMIACVSPADYNMDETLSTLRYADRARKIKNKPIVNQDPKAAEINRLNGIIHKLRLELLNKGNISGSNVNTSKEDLDSMHKTIDNLMSKNRSLQQQLQVALNDVADIEMRAVVAETVQDELHQKIIDVKNMIIELYNSLKNNNLPLEINAYTNMVEEIKKIIEEIDDKLIKNKEELLVQKQSFSSENGNINSNLSNGRQSLDEIEAIQQKYETFTTKQISYNNELRKMNRELILKEELHQKVAGNMSKFYSYDSENGEEKMKEFESLIKILEDEKNELNQKLRCVKDNVSAKLAEERRKRVQQLEQQILDMKKKNMQQAKLLKMREKESEKIKNLANEIREMKAAKVRLIRTMRAESENFRQWKLAREKEVTQLKEKDRKLQNEMVRKEALHNRQKNVLKRKVEEAMAINKRLKDAMEKQKVAQSQRKQNIAGKVDQVVSLFGHELEVILSVIDARFSLDQLMEDRAMLASRLKEVKNGDLNDSKDISTLEDELQMRNAQISDLQQKVLASDVESKIKAVCDGVHSMPEARAALKHMLNLLTDMRKEIVITRNKVEDLKSSTEMADEKILQLEQQIENIQSQHLEEKSSIERNCEEKITILLRELNKNPPPSNEEMSAESSARMKIQQEALDQLDTLREELEEYKKLTNDLKKQLEEQKFKKPGSKKRLKQEIEEQPEELEFSFNYDEDDSEDDPEDDPDWVKTPRYRARSTILRDEKQVKTDIARATTATKRSSDGSFRCSCKGNCLTKMCTCRKNSSSCSENCRCTENCANKSADNEESVTVNGTAEISNELDLKEEESTPKKLKLLPETENKLDVTTPSYPYSVKKRKPFFD